MSVAHLSSISKSATPVGFDSQQMLTDLAGFFDERQQAMTFYFGSAGASASSHEQEDCRLRSLISHGQSTVPGAETDLELLRSLESEIRLHPRLFRAVFASSKHELRHYIVLPVATDVGVLHFGRHFELLQLMRALEASQPYAVFLVENGKARVLKARGHAIEECEELRQEADIGLHPHNEREGWPHRVDANAEERVDRFLRQFAENARDYLWSIGGRQVVVGCRNAVWNKLQAEFARIGVNKTDRFHLTGFGMTLPEVLRLASAVHYRLQELGYKAFWNTLSADAGHASTDIEEILKHLQQGRVRQLFLGVVPECERMECPSCDSWYPVGTAICINCKNTVYATPVAELIVRKALQTGVEIIAPPPERLHGMQTGALLRY